MNPFVSVYLFTYVCIYGHIGSYFHTLPHSSPVLSLFPSLPSFFHFFIDLFFLLRNHFKECY